MRKLEDDFFDGNVSIDSIEKGLLQTKDEKYKIQNEFRIGIVLPYKRTGTNIEMRLVLLRSQ